MCWCRKVREYTITPTQRARLIAQEKIEIQGVELDTLQH